MCVTARPPTGTLSNGELHSMKFRSLEIGGLRMSLEHVERSPDAAGGMLHMPFHRQHIIGLSNRLPYLYFSCKPFSLGNRINARSERKDLVNQ